MDLYDVKVGDISLIPRPIAVRPRIPRPIGAATTPKNETKVAPEAYATLASAAITVPLIANASDPT